MTFDSAGNLFATMSQGTDYAVEKFTPAGVGSIFATAGLNVPDGLVFDSAGNLFVANQHSGQIVKFTPGGVGSVFDSGLNTPVNVAFDAAGNLFAVPGQRHRVQVYLWRRRSFFGSAHFFSFGLAFDKTGNLFVSNYNDSSIQEFTPGGVSACSPPRG